MSDPHTAVGYVARMGEIRRAVSIGRLFQALWIEELTKVEFNVACVAQWFMRG
jgi:hypothetical protein